MGDRVGKGHPGPGLYFTALKVDAYWPTKCFRDKLIYKYWFWVQLCWFYRMENGIVLLPSDKERNETEAGGQAVRDANRCKRCKIEKYIWMEKSRQKNFAVAEKRSATLNMHGRSYTWSVRVAQPYPTGRLRNSSLRSGSLILFDFRQRPTSISIHDNYTNFNLSWTTSSFKHFLSRFAW